jgi:hypothetical protein
MERQGEAVPDRLRHQSNHHLRIMQGPRASKPQKIRFSESYIQKESVIPTAAGDVSQRLGWRSTTFAELAQVGSEGDGGGVNSADRKGWSWVQSRCQSERVSGEASSPEALRM